ncbi:hypothetical protein A0H81_09823 [Grifola frondosa]|uniref:DUF6534 domain-containing protein n=1 Tax=Grifola frondosa TaxID=5627 RepID=A0A1C7M094_GRIFR|nr:hypothetical protein A0H81_09823 [Grifola frondosa]
MLAGILNLNPYRSQPRCSKPHPVTDVYISVSLCLILRGQQTGFKETNSLLTKLTVYAINRGMLTSTVQFLHLLTYLVTLHKVEFIWMIFHVPGSKVYANSLIAVLNVRQHLRRGGFISNPQLSGIMCTTEVYQEEDFPHNITKSHVSDLCAAVGTEMYSIVRHAADGGTIIYISAILRSTACLR